MYTMINIGPFLFKSTSLSLSLTVVIHDRTHTTTQRKYLDKHSILKLFSAIYIQAAALGLLTLQFVID